MFDKLVIARANCKDRWRSIEGINLKGMIPKYFYRNIGGSRGGGGGGGYQGRARLMGPNSFIFM